MDYKMEINYIDLFSGIGGFPIGLQMAGFTFNNHFYSEIDKYAIKVYKKHFKRAIGLGSITDVRGDEFGRQIDLITAGFPCQEISVSGKQKGLGAERSGLFYEIIRLAEVVSPSVIFLENVAALLSINGGNEMGEVLRSLAEIGYDAEWHCVPASHVGANHRRDRIWIVAYSNSNMLQRIKSKNKFNVRLHKEASNRIYSYFNEPRFKGFGNFKGIRERDGVSNRVDRLKCLGNAVVPQCVAYVANAINLKGIIKNEREKRTQKNIRT